jgi:hypothetical protein
VSQDFGSHALRSGFGGREDRSLGSSLVYDKLEDKVPAQTHSTVMTGKGTPPLARKQQRFLWRGLLIVLPALAMAGFGFVSLRQDRLLVRHQATEQAGKFVTELVQAVIPAALHVELPLPDATGLATFVDPILGAAQDGIIAALTDASGATVYPPPPRWPVPEPLDLQLLDATQLDLWTTARRDLFSGDDPAGSMERFNQAIEAGLPERFEALVPRHVSYVT